MNVKQVLFDLGASLHNNRADVAALIAAADPRINDQSLAAEGGVTLDAIFSALDVLPKRYAPHLSPLDRGKAIAELLKPIFANAVELSDRTRYPEESPERAERKLALSAQVIELAANASGWFDFTAEAAVKAVLDKMATPEPEQLVISANDFFADDIFGALPLQAVVDEPAVEPAKIMVRERSTGRLLQVVQGADIPVYQDVERYIGADGQETTLKEVGRQKSFNIIAEQDGKAETLMEGLTLGTFKALFAEADGKAISDESLAKAGLDLTPPEAAKPAAKEKGKALKAFGKAAMWVAGGIGAAVAIVGGAWHVASVMNDSSVSVQPQPFDNGGKETVRVAPDLPASQLPAGVTIVAPSESAPIISAPAAAAVPVADAAPVIKPLANLAEQLGVAATVNTDTIDSNDRAQALQLAYSLASRYQNTSGDARAEIEQLAISTAQSLVESGATGADINAGHSRILADAAFIAMRDPQFDRAEVIGWLDLAASAGDRVSDALLTEIESRRVYARGQLAAQQRGGPQPPPQ